MKERLTKLRKTLGLTMEKFGSNLGVTKTAISLLESGKTNLTDQMIKSICREYNVNYVWLTTGDEDMFSKSDVNFTQKIDQIMSRENDTRKNMFKALLNAPDEDVEALDRFISSYIHFKNEE